jgi:hypothetical protein
MKLREILLAEHSKKQTDKAVRYVGDDSKRFAELVKLFLGRDEIIARRAAWALSYCIEKHPDLVKPHLGKLISNLAKPGQHPAITRNTVRFLQDIDVPRKYLGRLTDICFQLLKDPASTIAVKAFSMTVLLNIAVKEPALAREARLVIQYVLPEASPGERNRGMKTIRSLEKLERT